VRDPRATTSPSGRKPPRRFLLDLKSLAIAAYEPLPMRRKSERFIVVEEVELPYAEGEQTQPTEDWRIAARYARDLER